MSNHDIQVTLNVSFNFVVGRSDVEDRTPIEVAALLQPRLNHDCFVWEAKIHAETAEGEELRVATFGASDCDYLLGIFNGDKAPVEEYLKSVPPGERAAWVVPEQIDSDDSLAPRGDDIPGEETKLKTAQDYTITNSEERMRLRDGIIEAIEVILDEAKPSRDASVRAIERLVGLKLQKEKAGDIVGAVAALWATHAFDPQREPSHHPAMTDECHITLLTLHEEDEL